MGIVRSIDSISICRQDVSRTTARQSTTMALNVDLRRLQRLLRAKARRCR